nr:RNA-directed DNA polymerase, eukaryota, reverse transcriptase zinc-binding domain protein [Tanacetum cinerariifolium]
MLRCFYLISGLKVNVEKSNVLGVGVSDTEISQMIFTSKLSSWKAKLLSVGGRLSPIKAVLGNLPTYFMSIYLMPVSIRSKLESMRSKFFRGVDLNESKMSWVKWEKCLNYSIANQVSSSNFNWSNVLRRDPKGGVESSQFEALKLAIGNVVLTHQPDSWQWSLDVAVGYSVSSARALVDDNLLVAGSERTRWDRHIPIKVNVFLWRLYLNKLPSRVNLNRKGIWLTLPYVLLVGLMSKP